MAITQSVSERTPRPTPDAQAAPLSRETVAELYQMPLMSLIHRAQTVHAAHHAENAVQLCTLMSIKTGGCPEDCSYCPQSAHYETPVEREGLVPVEEVLQQARRAKAAGASRFCMGAAWRSPARGQAFERVLEMIRGVRALDMEACVTLGMLNDEQVEALREAGLSAYNHNLDSSESFYDKIITTRSYADRLNTIGRVAKAGISVCSGGILGMGESADDHIDMIHTLASLEPQPESVPINALVAVEGTPMEDLPPVDPLLMARMCAVARITMPKARVRLSAGREELSREAQVLCFMAGANSVFFGDKLLTTSNPAVAADLQLLKELGVQALGPAEAPEASPLPKAGLPVLSSQAN